MKFEDIKSKILLVCESNPHMFKGIDEKLILVDSFFKLKADSDSDVTINNMIAEKTEFGYRHTIIQQDTALLIMFLGEETNRVYLFSYRDLLGKEYW